MLNTKKWNLFFLTSFLLNLIIIEVSFPSLGLRGELFAEVGTNFLYHARYTGFFESLLKTDTGYLPLFPRLISMFVHGVFPDFWFSLIVSQVTFIGVSLAGALLNLERFQNIFNHRKLTWVLSILYCFHHDYDQFALVNISYAFVPLIFFILSALVLNPEKKVGLLGPCIIALVFLSKAAFLSFFPALLLVLLWGVKFKQKNSVVTSCVGILCLMIQVGMLMYHRNEGPSTQANSIVVSLENELGFCGTMIQQTLFPLIKDAHGINLLLFMIALAATLGLIFAIRWKPEVFRVALIFISVLIGATIILDKSFGVKFDEPGLGFASTRFYWDRGKLISHYAAFFLILYLVIHADKLKKYSKVLVGYVLLINFSVLGNRVFYDRDPYRYEEYSFSHWKKDYPLTLEKEFCVPINPKGWRFCR